MSLGILKYGLKQQPLKRVKELETTFSSYLMPLKTNGLYTILVSYPGFCAKILIGMSFGFQRGFVTGGADKAVKFWDFELVKDENSTQKR